MPSARFYKADPERRESVLRAATEEFARAGWEGASVNRIIAAAKLSKGALYYWFEDKADLAGAVLERLMEELSAPLTPPSPPRDARAFWSFVRTTARAAVKQLAEDPVGTEALVKLGLALENEPELAPVLRHLLAERRRNAFQLFSDAVKVGAVRDDVSLDVLLPMAFSVRDTIVRAVVPPAGATSAHIEEATELVLDAMRRLLEPRRRARKTKKAPKGASR
jgi:AcrR family transcriptional regulator